MQRLSTVAGMLVVTLVTALAPAATARAATTPAAGLPIKIAHSNKCLNVSGGSTANSAKIVQYGCSSTATNDKFKIVPKGDGNYWIQGVGSGKCLNVQGGSTANGAAVIQYTCATSLNTLWKIDEVPEKPTIRFVSAGSGKCLNIPQASTADNVALIQYGCSASTTSLNEQFYLPPTASGTATHRPFTSKQPITARQGSEPGAGGVPPVYYSYIGTDNQLYLLTDRNPDPKNTDPNAPEPNLYVSFNFGYTGRTQAAELADGRVQVQAHDAAAGDVVLADEVAAGTGDYGNIFELGGATAAQPALGPVATTGELATFVVVGGALWYAPETLGNDQTPYGAWRSLGGSGLTGSPVSVRTATGVRIFALNTTGALLTATFTAGSLSDWASLGGTGLTGTPSVVVSPDTMEPIFVRTANGRVVTKKQQTDGSFPADWTPLGDFKIQGSPSAVLNARPGQLAVTARGADDLIYFAYETAPGSGEFGDWTLIADPQEHPETIAAGDPTAFAYDVPSGASFGITFPATDDENLPVVVTFDSQAKSAAPAPRLHKLDKPGKAVRLKG